jgi:uncharacterized protein (UPF0332 family)
VNEAESKALVTKARENIEAANLLAESGYIDVAVTRAYYAMFYCAQALLAKKEIVGSTHKRIISAFGKELVRTGEVPAALHRYLIEAQRERHLADYLVDSQLEAVDARETIGHAREMLAFTTEKLARPNRGPEPSGRTGSGVT